MYYQVVVYVYKDLIHIVNVLVLNIYDKVSRCFIMFGQPIFMR